MKKFANIRPPVLCALSICAGTLSGLAIYFFGESPAWACAALIPAAALFGVCFAVTKKILKPAILVSVCALFCVLSSLNSYYAAVRFDDFSLTDGAQYRITGRVTEITETENAGYAVLDGLQIDGVKTPGKMYVYLSPTYGEYFDEGYTVDFVGAVEKNSLFEYGKLNYYAVSGIKYSSAAYSGLQSTYRFSPLALARSRLKDVLYSNLNRETAATAYGMLTGVTAGVDENSLDSFRQGGVAHIFAVSGLHIGLVFSIVSFILKKLRLGNVAAYAVSVGFAFLYCALCGFGMSALRASIMCAVAAGAKMCKARYDGLNSLSVAVVVILALSPFSLFSVGFQLSVCAVGGIYAFSGGIAYVLSRVRTPQKIASAVGASFGAQLGTAPVMIAQFGYMSLAGLLLNIVVIPLFSVIFSVLFVSAAVCAIIPAIAAYILPYVCLPLELFISLMVAADFGKSVIGGFGSGLFVPLYFLTALALTDKLNIKPLFRALLFSGSAALLAGYILIKANAPFSGFAVTVSANRSGGEVLIKSQQGTVLILTDGTGTSHPRDLMNETYTYGVDAVVLLGDECAVNYLNYGLGCNEVYLSADRIPVMPYAGIEYRYEREFTVCGINFTFYDENVVCAEVGGVKIGVCAQDNTSLLDCDILISDYKNFMADCGLELRFNSKETTLSVASIGNLNIRIDGGRYRLENLIPPR